jgi:hypothetical protein
MVGKLTPWERTLQRAVGREDLGVDKEEKKHRDTRE